MGTKAAKKAHKATKAAKAKHAKYDALRVIAVGKALKYHAAAVKEQSRRVFLDKVSRAAKIAAASFRGKVVVQKKFTATAWKQFKVANKIAKHAKMIVHKRTSSSLRLKIKSTHFKFKTEQSKLNRIHSAWKKATDKKHKGVLAVRLALHKKRMAKWSRLSVVEKKQLAKHIKNLKKAAALLKKWKKRAMKMKARRVQAEADAKAAHKALRVAINLKNKEVKKAKIAKRNAIQAMKRMKEAVRRSIKAVARRLKAEAAHQKAKAAKNKAVKWANKMLIIKKIAFKLYLNMKSKAAHAKKMAIKMTKLAKMWVSRAKSMFKDAEKARRYADKVRHLMEKAQQVAREAAAALKRAQLRLKDAIRTRISNEKKLRIAVRARVLAHATLRAAKAAHKRSYAAYLRAKKTLFEAHAAVRRAVAARRIAETEAKKRLAVQAIKLHKWIASHIALRKSAMAASVRARIAAQVAHTQHMTGLRLRIRESRVQIRRTTRQTIPLAKMTAKAKETAKRAIRDARLRLRQRNVARRVRNRAIAAKVRAAVKAAQEAATQKAALIKAQAIRKAVHDYIMKVRLQHAVRNHKFDITQCKAAKKNLHALWGQHSLKSRKTAMKAARRNWCRAASTRMAQIKALHLVIKGKLTMKKVHSLRKAAFGLERRARGQHNYVWSPRKSTCKDKCMKYKDWLKVVTALAKAMAMKPCGKGPGAPMNGVKYITHNKSVKIVHGNKMVLTHHITYHVCKA